MPERITTALNPMEYPFEIRRTSFLWRYREGDEFDPAEDDITSGRIPILAIGSNASLQQLDRKFDDSKWRESDPWNSQIPMTVVEAENVDVVYAANLASYGSLPATIINSPRARITTMATWLTPLQFEHMNRTEALGHVYELHRIDDVTQGTKRLPEVYCYVASHGAATLDGQAVGLQSVEVENLEPLRFSGAERRRGDQQGAWDILAADMNAGTAMELFDQSKDPACRRRILDYLKVHKSDDRAPGERISPQEVRSRFE
jgi:hypothetical protein